MLKIHFGFKIQTYIKAGRQYLNILSERCAVYHMMSLLVTCARHAARKQRHNVTNEIIVAHFRSRF